MGENERVSEREIAIQHMPVMRVLGTRVHLIQIPEVVGLITQWIENRGPGRYIVNTGMHGVMEGYRHSDFQAILNAADLFAPDGISLTWLARRRGFGH